MALRVTGLDARSRFVLRLRQQRRRFESDAAIARGQGLDELPNGVDKALDLAIVAVDPRLQFGELRHDVLILDRGLSHLYEGAYDEDAHVDRALRVQHARGHDRAVFSEGVRQIAAAAMSWT
jgi:hypothetical protein